MKPKTIPEKYIVLGGVILFITLFIIGQYNNADIRIELDQKRLEKGSGYPGNILTASNAVNAFIRSSIIMIICFLYNYLENILFIRKNKKNL